MRNNETKYIDCDENGVVDSNGERQNAYDDNNNIINNAVNM